MADEVIARGTTPILTFDVDIDTTAINACYVTILGADEIEKTGQDVALDEGTISVALTQEDTLKLTGLVKMQIRAVMNDGAVVASNIVEIYAQDVLKDEVI